MVSEPDISFSLYKKTAEAVFFNDNVFNRLPFFSSVRDIDKSLDLPIYKPLN